MAWLALGLYLFYGMAAFGLRSWQQWRRTGSTGFRGVPGRPGSAGWWAGVLFVVALLAAFAAPVLQLAGVLDPVAVLDRAPVYVVGVALAVAGIAGTLAAQQVMGESWRIGVDTSETTALVRGGMFDVVRNPIFTAMLAGLAGLALLVPNLLALVAWVALLVASELTVRIVEEPYLRRTHGDAYREYTASVGRFLPRIGRAALTRS